MHVDGAASSSLVVGALQANRLLDRLNEPRNAAALVRVALRCFPTLLEQRVPLLAQESVLSLLHAKQPVAEAATDAGIYRVDPKRVLVEERAHLNAELPYADSDAFASYCQRVSHNNARRECSPKPAHRAGL